MQKPDESLDIDKPASEFPREESHHIIDEAEALEPVADGEVSTPSANPFLSWLRGSLAVGTVLAMIILVFLSVLSGVFIALDRSSAPQPEVATNARPAEEPAETEEPLSFDSFAESNFEPATPVRTHTRRRRARSPRVHVKGYRTRRLRRIRRPLVPLFMPTTLVIYVENGVIKTRIEPWLQTPR